MSCSFISGLIILDNHFYSVNLSFVLIIVFHAFLGITWAKLTVSVAQTFSEAEREMENCLGNVFPLNMAQGFDIQYMGVMPLS